MPTALNGQRVSASCTAASNVLPAFPRGAYTSGLLLPNGCLADWQQHLGRLAKSLHLLANGGVLSAPEALQQQLATALEVALYSPAPCHGHTLASVTVCQVTVAAVWYTSMLYRSFHPCLRPLGPLGSQPENETDICCETFAERAPDLMTFSADVLLPHMLGNSSTQCQQGMPG